MLKGNETIYLLTFNFSAMRINDYQKQAVEAAFSVEQATVVLQYLKERKSDYNPWLDSRGQWFDQTDEKGVPQMGEAQSRLLNCAMNGTTKVNSTLRLHPVDKIKLIIANQLEPKDALEVMEYLAFEVEEHRKDWLELQKLVDELMQREDEAEAD